MDRTKIYMMMLTLIIITSACKQEQPLHVDIYETSAAGRKMTLVSDLYEGNTSTNLVLNPSITFQTITGFGGSFTESSAYLLNKLSKENRNKILEAYFGDEGARYSLTRTHMSSCDFSLNNYTYAPVEEDMELKHFSIEEDKDDLIPMIKDAMAISKEGFKIIASPWTAPPWMKDNKAYVGGKLLPKYNDAYALFFAKYLEAYKNEGIDIWAITVVNEPHGNGDNWESMHFSPKEMTDFVVNHLGPKLEVEGKGNVNILGYDQNRAGLKEWVDEMYRDKLSSKYYNGTAIHWYESTYEVFPEDLQYAHHKAPHKYLIETEGCIDAEVPKWQDDAWYWKKEATDWGWDWAPEDQKYLHPKYAPVNRYARDIIGCLNNWVDGWVDWNMVLNRQGGPNWFKNWCVAPIIVDENKDEVYLTPIYYTLMHFSRFIRPQAKIIEVENSNKNLMVTAAENPDDTIAVVLFNENTNAESVSLELGNRTSKFRISPQSIQTIVIKN